MRPVVRLNSKLFRHLCNDKGYGVAVANKLAIHYMLSGVLRYGGSGMWRIRSRKILDQAAQGEGFFDARPIDRINYPYPPFTDIVLDGDWNG